MPRKPVAPTCFVPSCPADFVGQAGKVADVLMRKAERLRTNPAFAASRRWVAGEHASTPPAWIPCGRCFALRLRFTLPSGPFAEGCKLTAAAFLLANFYLRRIA